MLLRALKDLIRSRKTPDEGDLLLLAGKLIDQSRHDQAIEILNPLIENMPDSAAGWLLRGMAKREAGRPHEALTDLERAAALAPADPYCTYELAAAWHKLGDNARALDFCQRARRLAPDFPKPFALQAQIKLGGEFYFNVLARILGHLKPRTYVEIGVFRGESLRLATPPTLAIGIDPDPCLTAPPAANHRVFEKTSDAFFASHDLRAELGGLPVDVAFIDGMHHFEFALRDFANLERHCARGSIILIHDCYPLDRESSERETRSTNWSGDIWRLILLLKKYRPDLSVNTIGTPPTGLGLVRNLDPDSRFLSENHDRLCAEFLALDFSHIEQDMPQKLNLFPNDWDKLRTLLG